MLGLGASLSTSGAVSSGLAPDDISGLELWLKVNTGIVGEDSSGNAHSTAAGDMADADDITSWADQSGNNRHASQGTTSRKPHWETTAADFGGIRWTEADDDPHMNLASNVSISANQDFTIMIRVKIEDFLNAGGTGFEARSLIGHTSSNVIKIPSDKKISVLIDGGGGDSNHFEEASDTLTTSDYYIYTLTRSNGSTGDLEMRVHGGSYSDKDWDAIESHTDADAFTISNIGCAADAAIPMEGVFKDVIIWKGTALSDLERNDMYSYILGQAY